MVVRLQFVGPVGVLVRLSNVRVRSMLMFVGLAVVAVVGVRMGVLMNVRMAVLVHVLVRVCHATVGVRVPMAVQMRMGVVVAVFMIGVHRVPPFRNLVHQRHYSR
jgi:hypothetical protein